MPNEQERGKQEQQAKPWHTLPPGDALSELDSGRDGLSDDEARRRLEQYGPNEIRGDVEVSAWKVLLNQFTSPLIYVLLASLVVTLLLQRWSDATVIGLVLIVNGVVGFLQEYRAQSAIQALMEMVSPKADVRRGGEERAIESDRIVPGDVILLSEGDMIPADGRLIESASLQVNEAALTGESVPNSKREDAMEHAEEDLPPADIENMVYMGTAVTAGHGAAVATSTGASTQVGRIAESIRSAEEQKTPIQRRMDRLAKALAIGILIVAGVAFGVGLLMGNSVEEMFLLAVALAVAAMPAGLPVVMTVALAVGVRRMARRHAVIRHLPAVETLGSCTTIVSDKTGTLTRNQMAVREVAAGGRRCRISGGALERRGAIERDGESVSVEDEPALRMALLVGVLSSDPDIREAGEAPPSDERKQAEENAETPAQENEPEADDTEDAKRGTLQASGDPMEIGLRVAGLKAGLERGELLERYEQVDEVPFRTERRFSATIHRDANGEGLFVCVKGAPETILEMCDDQLNEEGESDQLDEDWIRGTIDDMAANGLRVLAMAIGRGDDAADRVRSDEPRGFTFAGLQGLLDPPRDSAVRAVDNCHEAGIRVIMVTGDHARTAAAIGKQVHLDRPVSVGAGTTEDRDDSGRASEEDGEPPEARIGKDLADVADEELDETLRSVNVFARFKPEQKLRLVRRLRENNQIVAVTGDGVNDAPALKEADLGAAMGQTGTDVAKEASDMVITDDNFASVYAAVEEGRTAFRNIRMATFFLLSTGAADVLIILSALAAGWKLPLLPAQILWCNVVTNGIADVALGFEPGERSLFRRPPRPPGEGILHRPLLERLVIIGIWLTVGVLGVFSWLYFWRDAGIDQARVAALTTLVLFQKVHVFNCRSEEDSIFSKSLLANKVLFIGVLASLAIHIAALYIPWTQDLLSLSPLDWKTWLVMIGIAFTAIIPNELHKWWTRRKR